MNMNDGFWVFGYGSLVWQPGFDYCDRQIARMDGFSRSFCMWSIHHRGTDDDPGLVLALDAAEGSYCDGVAFFVPPETAQQTIDYLRERELISSAYLEEVHLYYPARWAFGGLRGLCGGLQPCAILRRHAA